MASDFCYSDFFVCDDIIFHVDRCVFGGWMDMFPCHGLRICTRLVNMTAMRENCGMMVAVMPLGKQNQKIVLLLMMCKCFYTFPCIINAPDSLHVEVCLNYKPLTKKLNFWKRFVFMNEVHDEVTGTTILDMVVTEF